MTLDRRNHIPLSEVIEIKHGFAFQSQYFANVGDYQLLTPGNFNESGGFRELGELQKRYVGPVLQDFILDEGDVLVAMTEQSPGLLGATIKIPKANTYLHNQRLGLVTVRQTGRVSKGYLYHLFNASYVRKEIAAGASGTKVKHTSPTKLCSVEVYLPTLREQEEVANILDASEASERRVERLIQAKERRHRGLVHSLISGRHARRHWETTEFGSVVKERTERSATHDQHPVLTSSRRGIFLQTEYFSKQVTSIDNTAYKVMHRGDFTFRSMSDDGRFAFNRLTTVDAGIISPAYGVFFATDCVADFLVHFLNSAYFASALNRASQGGTRKALRFSAIAQLEVDLPPLQEQKRIARVLDSSLQEIETEKRRLDFMTKQRRGLMQKLLTGQWRVKAPRTKVA